MKKPSDRKNLIDSRDSIPDSPGASRDIFISSFCDLHVHTSASDGSLTPIEVVNLASRKGLKAVAICDHDTMAGFAQIAGLNRCTDLSAGPASPQEKAGSHGPESLPFPGIEVIPGIEINSEWNGHEVHILGYYVPLDDEEFGELLEKLRRSRYERIRLMVEKLQSIGIYLDFDRVKEIAGGDSLGRPHVGEAMVEKGYVASVKEAFAKYLGIGKPAYVERYHLDPEESVERIRKAGGVAVWAHPGTAGADELLQSLIEKGLQGLEVYHPEHDRRAQQKYLAYAKRFGLVVTGGSDFHGPGAGEGADLGSYGVPYEVVSTLKELGNIPAL